MLLCGADLLESFATPGGGCDQLQQIFWNHGVVVITRPSSNLQHLLNDPVRFDPSGSISAALTGPIRGAIIDEPPRNIVKSSNHGGRGSRA
jgi:hypothetical protein